MPALVEGFGLVCLEALAAGLHCIGSTHSGLPDLHAPPAVATGIEAGDVEAPAASLARASRAWRKNRIVRTEIAEFGNRRSWKDHREDMKRVVASLLD